MSGDAVIGWYGLEASFLHGFHHDLLKRYWTNRLIAVELCIQQMIICTMAFVRINSKQNESD
jgi:hypothetical protein